jgi:hypothetical protein
LTADSFCFILTKNDLDLNPVNNLKYLKGMEELDKSYGPLFARCKQSNLSASDRHKLTQIFVRYRFEKHCTFI